MKRYVVILVCGGLLLCALAAALVWTGLLPRAGTVAVESGPYRRIWTKEVFAKLITRNAEDRVYSGQIKSKDGLAKFKEIYSIDFRPGSIDFNKHMLLFGITDTIATRAFRFLKQEKTRSYVLDYADAGIEYKIRTPAKGKKHSYLQVFVLDRIDGIPHVNVKNLVRNGLSRLYE